MGIIQDLVNDVKPSPSEIEEGLIYLKEILPQYKHEVSEGKIGIWRYLPDGQLVFHCPAVYLPKEYK